VVLKAVAGRIKNMLRLTDTLARYGGEEFVVLLEQADAAQAFVVAERIREAVRQPAIPLDNGALIPITVSIGISSFVPRPQDDGAAVSAQRLLHEADTALYRAKTTGRNRVVAFTTEAAADPAASPSPEATS
jgi:diguanylate cyclase (GGDEF)-like protein